MELFPYFTEIIGILRKKYIAWDFGSRIQARFQLGFQHLRPRFQLVTDPSVRMHCHDANTRDASLNVIVGIHNS